MGPEQSLMTNQELHDQESRSSTEIESDIRQTRGRMDATLDELNDRLSARSLLNSALDWWESRGVGSRPVGATKDTYQSVARYVKENPIPSLLVGAGVAWMIIEATTEEDDKRGSRAGRVGLPYEGRTASSFRAEFPETADGIWQQLAAWLRTRKTNWEKQKKPSRELPEPLRIKSPQWVKRQARLRRN